MTINNTGIKRIFTKLKSKLDGKANSNHTHQVFITNPFSLTPGVETSLGDGTYIQRFTGNGSVSANTYKRFDLITSARSTNTGIVEYGGYLIQSSGTEYSIPFCNISTSGSSISVNINSDSMALTVVLYQSATITYDVWIRYIKI